MNKLWNRARNSIRNICIVDRFLMVFMLILFSYMVYYVLTGGVSYNDSNTIGIIVRTSAAAIFGYFISSNFAKRHSSIATKNMENHRQNLSSTSMSKASDNYVKNKIGFQSSSDPLEEDLQKNSIPEELPASTGHCSKIQVIVVSMVGLFSLVILLMAQNYPDETPELTAIISQLRDFISACIGFLISCGKNTV